MRQKRAREIVVLIGCAGSLAFAQAGPAAPAADIHASGLTIYPQMRTPRLYGERYEVRFASEADLIHLAYGMEPEQILGGPNWLEWNRFDVAMKVPAGTTTETVKPILQALLADRFGVAAHSDTRPTQGYALTTQKQRRMRPSTSSGEPGCTRNPATDSQTVQYACRGVTMAAFADALRRWPANRLTPGPVVDQTGLQGAWDFDLTYGIPAVTPSPDGAATQPDLATALERQPGLKLEAAPIPTEVLIVDAARETPSANPPGLSESLPEVAAPKEFEVATIRPSDPNGPKGSYRVQPGGRLTVPATTLRPVFNRAFGLWTNEELVGLPGFGDTDRYDIAAKAPAGLPGSAPVDIEAMVPMLRSLLVDRFKIRWHEERRPVTAYSLVAAKPKLKPADPAARSSCTTGYPPAGSPAGSVELRCRNVSVARFAEQLQGKAPGLLLPVVDSTGIEGRWDIQLVYAMGIADPAGEPTGAETIFEAVERRLGLRLEKVKRPERVIVIDEMREKPIEN